MHTHTIAVTIQPSKIALNKVKDNWALLAPLHRKKTNKLSGQPNSLSNVL